MTALDDAMMISDEVIPPDEESVGEEGSAQETVRAGAGSRLEVLRADQVINAERIEGGVHYHGQTRRRATATVLDPEGIDYLGAVFVRPGPWSEAAKRLRTHRAVVLVGAAGTGRRTAAVNLLVDAGVVPQELALEANDTDQSLVGEPGCGYLVDLAPFADDPESAGVVLDRCLSDLGETENPLVVLSTKELDQALNPDRRGLSVPWSAPASAEIFRSHLARLLSPREAAGWFHQPEVTGVLDRATPADAVRLAGLVRDVVEGETGGAVLTRCLPDVLDAYGNWESELRDWDRQTEVRPDAGERRAMLLAVAALQGESPATIVTAAERLMSFAGVDADLGGALVGPGVSARMELVDHVGTDHGVVFTRPAYAPAVLDRAWTDRPRLRKPLQKWLMQVGRETGVAPVRERAGETLLGLAARQAAPWLVLDAAADWARGGRRRSAADLLTVAGTDPAIGWDVRRRLYEWATNHKVGDSLHLVVAAVCAGELADAYPAIALTRLRHLANRESRRVRLEATQAMAELSRRPRLRWAVHREVLAWMGDSSALRASTGRWTFFALARLLSAEGRPIALQNPLNDQYLDGLAQGWREVLRAKDTGEAAAPLVGRWLDAAIQDVESRSAVVQVFGRACRSSVDAALVRALARNWARTEDDSATTRDQVCEELLDLCRRQVELPSVPRPVPTRNGSTSPNGPMRAAPNGEEGTRAHNTV